MSETEERIPCGEKQLDAVTIRFFKTKDELKLFAAAEVGEPYVPPAFETFAALFGHIPAECLHSDIVKDLFQHLAANVKLEPRRVSKGRSPVNGKDGRLLLLVKPFTGSFRPGELDQVDPKYVRAFDNIEVGAVVARVYPETPGQNGVSALGNPLPPVPGKPFVLELDPDSVVTKSEPGFQSLVAKKEGFLQSSSGKIAVVDLLKISGDVGYKTGDIDFIGAVNVKGNVSKEFQIRARKDITIEGTVTSAILASEMGSIRIKGGATGDLLSVVNATTHSTSHTLGSAKFSTRSEIVAKAEVHSERLEGIFVEAGGDIIVQKEIRSCILSSKAAVRIPKGSLIGGTTKIICGLEALNIGTNSGSNTQIFLLSDVESSLEYSELHAAISRHEAAEHALELHLGPYAKHPTRITLLLEPQRGKMKKLSQELTRLQTSRDELLKKKALLLDTAKFNRLLRVNVLGTLYPGVTINVGKEQFSVEEKLIGPKTIEYFPEDKIFRVSDIMPLLCGVE